MTAQGSPKSLGHPSSLSLWEPRASRGHSGRARVLLNLPISGDACVGRALVFRSPPPSPSWSSAGAAWCMMQQREGVSTGGPGTRATRGRARAPRGRGDSSTPAAPGGVPSRRCPGDLPLHGAVRGTPPRHAVPGSVVSRAARRVDSIRSPRQVPCDRRPAIPARRVASVVPRGHFGGTPSWVGFPGDLIRPAQTVLPDGVEWEEVLPAP